MIRYSVVLIFLLFSVTPASSEEKRDGWFIALKSCEAYQSKNKLTNPGEVHLSERTAYDMVGINKEGGSWYRVKVPGAPVTIDRWVAAACGVHVISAEPGTDTAGNGPVPMQPIPGAEATDLLLALSWQPSFCEKKSSKPECRQLNDGLLPVAATQLSLHGLWPQPNGNFYCGVSEEVKQLDRAKRWSELPAPELDADTAARLAVAMPGTASFLHRHEWIKHGTCFFGEGNGDEYYDDSLLVLANINESRVGQLFAENVGSELSTSKIRKAFDSAFGEGAGERVQVQCTSDQGRVLIQELRITMKGEISETADIGSLIRAGEPQSPGCSAGLVDPAGLQ